MGKVIDFKSALTYLDIDAKDMVKENESSSFVITDYYKQNAETDSIYHLTQSILNTHLIELTPDDKLFQLSFALLDYNNPQNCLNSFKKNIYFGLILAFAILIG